MSRLSKFLGKPKTYTLGTEEIELKPLIVDDLDIILEMENEAKRAGAVKEIVKRTLKRSFPEASEEEIASFGLAHFEQLVTAIMDVNGLSDARTRQGQKGIGKDTGSS